MNKIALLVGMIGLAWSSSSAKAQTLDPNAILPAGQSLWSNEIPANGQLTIRVNLATQMAYVSRDNQIIAETNISSGREGFKTPTGRFPIWGKEVNHFSHAYKANMPYTQWLTRDGVALHSGSVRGKPSSHGCIHLPQEFAARLFAMTQIGDVVEITDGTFEQLFAEYAR